MDVLLRSRGIGLLLTLLICSPVLAQEPDKEDSHVAPGNDPHAEIHSAIENADNLGTQALPLEELQMFGALRRESNLQRGFDWHQLACASDRS